MTWSARSNSDCGIVSPSAFAVFKLLDVAGKICGLSGCTMNRRSREVGPEFRQGRCPAFRVLAHPPMADSLKHGNLGATSDG
jgi:hypothetical protein